MLKLGILVSGRGSNLQAIIDAIEGGKLEAEIAIVISDQKAALALERAEKHLLKTLFLDPEVYQQRQSYDAELVKILNDRQVELVVLAGFMRILSPYFIRGFKDRIINIHPSLLPAFPGLNAQRQALDYGVKVSGCTVHFVDEGMDNGPIILQETVPVKDSDKVETLAARILKKEHQLLPRVIKLYGQGRLEIEGRCVKITG